MNGLLRQMTAADLDMVRKWRNHHDIKKFMFNQAEISEEDHQVWFDRVSKDEKKHILIYSENDKEALGFIQFSPIRNHATIMEWGFYIAPNAKKGTGTRMTTLALDYAFNQLQAHKVFAEILEYNEPSIKLHRRLGFNQEGLLKDHHYDGRNYYTVICFGLINPINK